MAKLTLVDLASLQNETTALQSINANNAAIEEAFENTFSRDGTLPNQLEADFDVNSQRLINLAPPEAGTDAARLVDIQEAGFPDIVIPSQMGNEDKILSTDGSNPLWVTPATLPGVGDLKAVNNLSELTSASTSRTNLGLGSASVEDVGTSGDSLGKLNTNNTWSGTQSFSAAVSTAAGVTFSGSSDVRLSNAQTALAEDSVGFRGAPQNTQDATYTLVLTDSGKTVRHTSASTHTWTIPPNADVAYPLGTTIVLVNLGSGAVTVARGSGVALRVAGSATDANKSFAQYGLATLYKADTNSWLISGSGVS